MQIKDFLKTQTYNKLPAALKTHGAFNKIKNIDKPFPHIGLTNSLEELHDPKHPNHLIGFSSVGAKGLWDIATMSMRGVCSCMHWNNLHSRHLVGSIFDPFLGIVYISDNTKTEYGITFKKRCLVRFIYETSGRFGLLLERVYIDTGNQNPLVYINKDPDYAYSWEIFVKFLSQKIDKKYTVHTSHPYGYIPYSTGLKYIQENCRSMSDCGSYYRNVPEPHYNEIKAYTEQD